MTQGQVIDPKQLRQLAAISVGKIPLDLPFGMATELLDGGLGPHLDLLWANLRARHERIQEVFQCVCREQLVGTSACTTWYVLNVEGDTPYDQIDEAALQVLKESYKPDGGKVVWGHRLKEPMRFGEVVDLLGGEDEIRTRHALSPLQFGQLPTRQLDLDPTRESGDLFFVEGKQGELSLLKIAYFGDPTRVGLFWARPHSESQGGWDFGVNDTLFLGRRYGSRD